MQTKPYTNPNAFATNPLANIPPHLPIQPRTRRNITLSSVLILSLASTLNANPNENNLDYTYTGGGAAQNK